MTKPVSNRANKASIHAVIGSTGSGKTSHVMECIKRGKPGRILIWDTKGEFAREGHGRAVTSMAEIAQELLKAGPRGRFALAFQPKGDAKQMQKDFSRLCLLAFHAKNCWLIAEELADVTQPMWAPEGWRKATTQGRTEGLTIYGLSQSPALIDKTFFTNCSTVRTGRVNFEDHAKTVAKVFGLPHTEIMALEDGQWIQIQFSPREIKRGRLF